MKIFLTFPLILAGFLQIPICVHADGSTRSAAPILIHLPADFDLLSENQLALFKSFAEQKGANEDLDWTGVPDYRKSWIEMSESQRTTFIACTNALEQTPLKNGQNALSLVEKVTQINGDLPTEPSYKQFNIHVVWIPNAVHRLQEVGFKRRLGWGHRGEKGYSYAGRTTGLHLLFRKSDDTIGDFHLDYRKASFLTHGEGHFQPYSSDIRAVGPETKKGIPISNFARYIGWFGSWPGKGFP